MVKKRETAKIVKSILEMHPEARDSDDRLYVLYVDTVLGSDHCWAADKPFREFMLTYRGLGLSSIETVGRCRRRIQTLYPELLGRDEVTLVRELEAEDFKAFSQEVF